MRDSKIYNVSIILNELFLKHHATNTENYLVGKDLLDEATIQGAISTLADELAPDSNLIDSSPEFSSHRHSFTSSCSNWTQTE